MGTLALASLLGMGLNMLSLVALLMVVSMGVDYGVLLAENRDDERAFAATHHTHTNFCHVSVPQSKERMRILRYHTLSK